MNPPHPACSADRRTAGRLRHRPPAARAAPAASTATRSRPPWCITHRPTGICGPKPTSAAARPKISARPCGGCGCGWRSNSVRPLRHARQCNFEPSPLWRSRVQRRADSSINPAHDDFPALLAEALDAVAAAEFDVAAAARWLGISTTQLTRFLQDEPLAWAGVNAARRQRGLRPLHLKAVAHAHCFLDIDGTLVSTGGAGQAAFAVTLDKDFGITNVTTSRRGIRRPQRPGDRRWTYSAHGIEPTPEVWSQFHVGYIKRLDEVLPAYKGRVLPGVVPALGTTGRSRRRCDRPAHRATSAKRPAASSAITSSGIGSPSAVSATSTPIATTSPPPRSPPVANISTATAQPTTASSSSSATRPTTSAVPARSAPVRRRADRPDLGRNAFAAGKPDVLVDTLEDSTAVMALFDE